MACRRSSRARPPVNYDLNRSQHAAKTSAAACGVADSPSGAATPSATCAEPEERDYHQWFCSLCERVNRADEEDPERATLLMCDGGCLRSFHPECVADAAEEPGIDSSSNSSTEDSTAPRLGD